VSDESGSVYGLKGHHELGRAYLRRRGFSEKVAALVHGHVNAKRLVDGT
jgi:hypothetical protein